MPRCALPYLFCLLILPSLSSGQDAGWLRLFSRELGRTEKRIQEERDELTRLGVAVMSQTTEELGYQHRQLPEPPPVPPWVQVDLGSSQAIDWIVLVPALVDWQQGESKPYAFPRRFRIDVSDDPAFARFTPAALFMDADYPSHGLTPAVVRAGGLRGRYIRLTIMKLAEETATHSFALSEIMVIQGVRNIALRGSVTASNTVNLPPRWHVRNLNDGRSPLGPPIQRDFLPYDGLFTGVPGTIAVDLAEQREIDEVRLHPVHARLGADVPGFSFPTHFVVEVDDGPDFESPTVLMDSSVQDYPNPGNNPVVIPLPEAVRGRHLRIRMLASTTGRCGLSEIEVFSGGENVALGSAVISSPDTVTRTEERPTSLISDGYTSYGRLLPLPDWLERWERRDQLQAEIRTLSAAHAGLLKSAQRKAWVTAGLLALILPGGGLAWAVSERRRRVRSLQLLRNRIAQDLHDEIGSNIAGIAIISETAPGEDGERQKEDWLEINRIARETSDSMREVLWLVGARAESGPDFTSLLRRTAGRLLSGMEVEWAALPDPLPDAWQGESRRQVFLIFKEALANISRHSGATRVTLSLECSTDTLRLEIHDNGRGFTTRRTSGGMGINGMKERARNLHGRLTITSAPGDGTRLILVAPLQSPGSPSFSH
jgi:signal transduction histidine kinase